MAFFDKLKNGLKKTKDAVINRVDAVVKSFRSVDEDLLEELEEIMICADMGVETTEEVIDELRDRIKEENIGLYTVSIENTCWQSQNGMKIEVLH